MPFNSAARARSAKPLPGKDAALAPPITTRLSGPLGFSIERRSVDGRHTIDYLQFRFIAGGHEHLLEAHSETDPDFAVLSLRRFADALAHRLREARK